MHRPGNPYEHGRPQSRTRVKAQTEDKHPYRYVGLLIAGLIVVMAVTVNARAEGLAPRPPATVVWTDHNTHDPGQNVDPQKLHELQAELAAEMAAEATATGKARPAHDAWLLHSFGVGSTPRDH